MGTRNVSSVSRNRSTSNAVSYTHLDVYKRQSTASDDGASQSKILPFYIKSEFIDIWYHYCTSCKARERAFILPSITSGFEANLCAYDFCISARKSFWHQLCIRGLYSHLTLVKVLLLHVLYWWWLLLLLSGLLLHWQNLKAFHLSLIHIFLH